MTIPTGMWNEVVRKYLEAGYESENKQCELTIRDKKYQILRRDSITVFYDEKRRYVV